MKGMYLHYIHLKGLEEKSSIICAIHDFRVREHKTKKFKRSVELGGVGENVGAGAYLRKAPKGSSLAARGQEVSQVFGWTGSR